MAGTAFAVAGLLAGVALAVVAVTIVALLMSLLGGVVILVLHVLERRR